MDISVKHDKAMEYAGLAELAKQRGHNSEADKLYLQAYELESRIALQLANSTIEPSRSIIHRSAASLAIECGKYREAEKLISVALAGEPPAEIVRDLRDLLWQILPVLRDKVG